MRKIALLFAVLLLTSACLSGLGQSASSRDEKGAKELTPVIQAGLDAYKDKNAEEALKSG